MLILYFALVFPFCKNPEENPTFAVCFTKHWQDTLLLSLHNFLATIFQCMPQPTLARAETEASLIKKLQEENLLLRNRLQQIAQSQQQNPTSSSHQSRLTAFNEQKSFDQTVTGTKHKLPIKPSNVQSINDIIPFDILAPTHIVDDFFIIAQETHNTSHIAESQARGLKSLIRNIGSSGSPVMGRKESSDRSKRRSGSTSSRGWMS